MPRYTRLVDQLSAGLDKSDVKNIAERSHRARALDAGVPAGVEESELR